MRFESAELSKISINCCLVAAITVANTLAELCERIGADWAEIAPALRLDRRIGAYSYLVPGLGLAGGNLERDLATVLRISEDYGTDASLIRAFVGNSAHRRDWPLRALHELVLSREPRARIGVLGLAYKENTHSVKNSPSLALIKLLAPWPLQVYDPVVKAEAAEHPKATSAVSALAAAEGVDALAIMTPWPEFRKLAPADLAAAWNQAMVPLCGAPPATDRVGVLQDAHWAVGSFGYFPSYTIGNLYAAQLFEAWQRVHPDGMDALAAGDPAVLRDWLREVVYRVGHLKSEDELVRSATGSGLDPEPFLRYVRARYVDRTA